MTIVLYFNSKQKKQTQMLIYEKTSKIGNRTLVLEIDGSKTIEQFIAAGKYDQVHPDINQTNFSITDTTKRTVEIELFNFNFNPIIYGRNAVEKMYKKGFRPIVIEELLSLGEKSIDLKLEFSILALGTVCSAGERYYNPFLDVNGIQRKFDLRHTDLGWAPGPNANRCGAIRIK